MYAKRKGSSIVPPKMKIIKKFLYYHALVVKLLRTMNPFPRSKATLFFFISSLHFLEPQFRSAKKRPPPPPLRWRTAPNFRNLKISYLETMWRTSIRTWLSIPLVLSVVRLVFPNTTDKLPMSRITKTFSLSPIREIARSFCSITCTVRKTAADGITSPQLLYKRIKNWSQCNGIMALYKFRIVACID